MDQNQAGSFCFPCIPYVSHKTHNTKRTGPFGRQSEGDPVKADSPQQKCCDMGASLLASVFKSHPATRTEIVEQFLNRVITRASSPSNHFIGKMQFNFNLEFSR